MSALIQRCLVVLLGIVLIAWSRGQASVTPWTPQYVVVVSGMCAAISVILVWVPDWLPYAGTVSDGAARFVGWMFHVLVWLALWAQFSAYEARHDRDSGPPPDHSREPGDLTRPGL